VTEPALGTALLSAVGLQRIAEIAWSRSNVRRLVARGGVVIENDGLRGLVVVHVLWLAGMVGERAFLDTHAPAAVASAALAGFVAGEALRAWTFATLGRRWTMKVVVRHGEAPVRRGPFRFLRHPNYVALTLEMLLLPLALGAWRTAALVLVPHAATLVRRIRLEEAAWRETAGTALP
jgi:methyltransferase